MKSFSFMFNSFTIVSIYYFTSDSLVVEKFFILFGTPLLKKKIPKNAHTFMVIYEYILCKAFV